MRAWWACPGFLYFLAVGPDPHFAIKIGVAAQTGTSTPMGSLKRRLDQIQSSNHEPIQVLGLIYYDKANHEYPMWHADAMERRLHNEFQHLARFARDTRGSEWFTSAPALLARIKEISKPPDHFGLPRIFSVPITATPA
jgi:hypothetical protein